MTLSPAEYNAWYATPRGVWISHNEFKLMMSMMQPEVGETLLDVGCGTGHFSRLFSTGGLSVTGIDPDAASIEFARSHSHKEIYEIGDVLQLPYDDNEFEYCTAVTSLCFVNKPEKALQEMWRVSRKGVMLGLLNRNSLLYRERNKHPGYRGARWDGNNDVQIWIDKLPDLPGRIQIKSAVFFPTAGILARAVENFMPTSLPIGSFLGVYLEK